MISRGPHRVDTVPDTMLGENYSMKRRSMSQGAPHQVDRKPEPHELEEDVVEAHLWNATCSGGTATAIEGDLSPVRPPAGGEVAVNLEATTNRWRAG